MGGVSKGPSLAGLLGAAFLLYMLSVQCSKDSVAVTLSRGSSESTGQQDPLAKPQQETPPVKELKTYRWDEQAAFMAEKMLPKEYVENDEVYEELLAIGKQAYGNATSTFMGFPDPDALTSDQLAVRAKNFCLSSVPTLSKYMQDEDIRSMWSILVSIRDFEYQTEEEKKMLFGDSDDGTNSHLAILPPAYTNYNGIGDCDDLSIHAFTACALIGQECLLVRAKPGTKNENPGRHAFIALPYSDVMAISGRVQGETIEYEGKQYIVFDPTWYTGEALELAGLPREDQRSWVKVKDTIKGLLRYPVLDDDKQFIVMDKCSNKALIDAIPNKYRLN